MTILKGGSALYKVEFEPVGRRGTCSEGSSLLECARHLKVDIVSLCGGVGACRRCRIQDISGGISLPTVADRETFTEKELDEGWRLACMAIPQGDVRVLVPPESLSAPQRTLVEGIDLRVKPDPLARSLEVQMAPPSVEYQEPDDRNLWRALAHTHGVAPGTIDLAVQQSLSSRLRSLGWKASVVLRGSEVIALDAPPTRWIGLAVDIGTTKIAVYLVDMKSGEIAASSGLMNPQISYGEDVVSRIYLAGASADNAEKMQSLLVEALNRTVAALCTEIGSDPSHVVDAVLVANTAIHHLLLRLPVQQLGLVPYVPAVCSAIDIKARDIGLKMAPGAYVHTLPNIAGYVGADHVAMLLATGVHEKEGVTLALDIGTNTEICLNCRGRMKSVSCASGPAFEGAHIQFGMRAAKGAIERVRMSDGKVDIQTIGGSSPAGLCGSGLLDAIAQMLQNGVIDASGRMQDHARVRLRNDRREFILVERPGEDAITISQKDVRELQAAKTAIRLGIQALLEDAGIAEADIDRVIIAGAFGTYIDVQSAMTIGMLPPLPLDRFQQVGNAAGTGARLALISQDRRRAALEIAARDGYIELATIPDFNEKFAEASSMSW
ncbi:MAG: ASKHA domain-containing protein [Acidobacteriota bacterium]|nr:ASKHA domain-containing protein [Acidobacteriota bacterium]